MAIVPVPPHTYPITFRSANPLGTIGNTAMTSAGNKQAFIFRAPVTGTITEVHVRSGTPVGSSGNADVRIETVDLTTGDPTGTLAGTNANGTITINATNTWFTATLTGSLAVTQGDLLAFVIVNSTGSYSIRTSTIFQPGGTPYADSFAAAWTKSATVAPSISLNYGGTYAYLQGVVVGMNSLAISTSTTPDEIGNLWVPLVSQRVYGIEAVHDLDGDCDFILYDSNSGVLASVSADKDVRLAASAGTFLLPFSSSIQVAVGQSYRLVAKPSTTTSGTAFYTEVDTAAARAACPGGAEFTYTTRTDAGAWSQTTTRQAMILPMIDGIDNGISPNRVFGAL
jgi:hypothetical protein